MALFSLDTFFTHSFKKKIVSGCAFNIHTGLATISVSLSSLSEEDDIVMVFFFFFLSFFSFVITSSYNIEIM